MCSRNKHSVFNPASLPLLEQNNCRSTSCQEMERSRDESQRSAEKIRGEADREAMRLLRSQGTTVEGVLCPREPQEQAVRGGYLHLNAPLPSFPFWRTKSWTAPYSQLLNPPWEEYMHMDTHTHIEEESPGAEQSRAEHLDLPLLTHSGIRGTDGRRDEEGECTLG